LEVILCYIAPPHRVVVVLGEIINPVGIPTNMPIRIGSIVRATMPKSQYRRSALVVSIQDDERRKHDDHDEATASSPSYCLLWEDEAPKAIEGTFIVSPEIKETDGNQSSSSNGEEEVVVARTEISELFEFEGHDFLRSTSRPTMMNEEADSSSRNSALVLHKDKSATEWKECGDVLLREKDAAAAVGFYELALRRTSRVRVGSTVLVQRANKAGPSAIVRADVDCINKDDNTVDLTMEDNDDGAEETVPAKHVRLSIDPNLADLQERILLNLSRCLLQLADQCPSHRRSAYLQGARLGCTMALAIPDATKPESSWLLRSKAYAASNKFPQALADVQNVLSMNPNHLEGQTLLKDLERRKAAVAKTNKRLAKDVSQWVQSAMMNQEASSAEQPVSARHDYENASETQWRQSPNAAPAPHHLPWPSLMMLVLVAILAWILQAAFFQKLN
jgi:tetratricopeptide (TPR) repeat protein